MSDLAFWTVADDGYTLIAKCFADSYAKVGMPNMLHVFATAPFESPSPNVKVHAVNHFPKDHYLFKLSLLSAVADVCGTRYIAFIDADSYFIRPIDNPLRVMQGSPIHSFLESDCCSPKAKRPDWWGCPLPTYVSLMRERGVINAAVRNVNAGFFIVDRLAIPKIQSLAMGFWHFCKSRGYVFTEEAPLAYATHILCGDSEDHTLAKYPDYWASDWTGHFSNLLPDGIPWMFTDYMTDEKFMVSPALIHAMRSKEAMKRFSLEASRQPAPQNNDGQQKQGLQALRGTAS